jgi:hypothetical protein
MSLLTLAYVEQYFPKWGSYCLDDENTADEDILQLEIDAAEQKLAEYVDVDADTITDPLKLHTLNIIRKRCFDRQHGDVEFENKPSIIKDYEDTIKMLEGYKAGNSLSGTDPAYTDKIIVVAKDRIFDESFVQTEDEED